MRLVGFDQGRVTLELDADECLSLSQACQLALAGTDGAVTSDTATTAFAAGLRPRSTYRSLRRGLLACARVGHRQRHLARGMGAARPLGISERRRQAIVIVD